MLYVLGMGQSNCGGRGTDGAWDIAPGVTAWNSYSEVLPWASPGLSNTGTAWVAPVKGADPFYSRSDAVGYNSPIIHAASYLSKLTGQDVRVIIVPGPSQEMSQWMDSTGTKGPYYHRMAAITAAAGVPRFDAFFWQHGEKDSEATRPLYYQAKWDFLVSALSSDGYIDANTAIVLGMPNMLAAPIHPVMRAIEAADPRVGVAETATYGLMADAHFAGPMAKRMGFAYMRALERTSTPLSTLFEGRAEGETKRAVGSATCGMSVANDTWTRIPLACRFGSDLFGSGDFVADRHGLWRISLRGGGLMGGTGFMQIGLLDASGSVLEVLSVDANSTYGLMSGSTVLDLAVGDKLKFGIRQVTGSPAPLSYVSAQNYFMFDAEFVGCTGNGAS